MQHKYLFVILLFCLLSFSAMAQFENQVWFFGNSTTGIRFDINSNVPIPFNMQYTPYGGEGCGVVTDRITGELQFYSDGATLVNRNHQAMPNGVGLGGCPSSAQAVGMSQVPGVCNHYYVFSNWRGSGCPSNDLRYSIVNMNADNGLGDVVVASKNTLLRTGISEGMIVIPIPNTKDFWLVGMDAGTGAFYVYKVDINGIIFSGNYNLGNCAFTYNLTYSPTAGKIAQGCPSPGNTQVFDFDINTGVISNPQMIDASMPSNYDVEWSPDGTKLYYSSWTNLVIRQYDLNTGTITTLSSPGTRGGGLRLGPDGFIYHISDNTSTFLSRIENPNAAGVACNYVVNAYNAGGVIGGLNLPEILTTTNVLEIELTEDSTNVLCKDGNTGTAQVTPVGGNPPYTYIWSNGDTTSFTTDLTVGIYDVTVTDTLNCRSAANFNIEEPDSLVTSLVQVTNTRCAGFNDGAIDMMVVGGTTPYSYLWNNGAVTEDLSSIAAGNYILTVTDSNGCVDSLAAQVIQPSALLLSSNADSTQCNGENSGRIILNASGSVPPYTFNWSNGDTLPFADSLLAGIYTVTVTDDTGCTGIISDTVNEPLALSIVPNEVDITCHGGADGSVDLDVSGATAPYSYLWTNGSLSEDVSGLSQGTYAVTVTDDNGCQDSSIAVIDEPSPWTVAIVTEPASCFGVANGRAALTVSGNTGGYTYDWSDPTSIDAPVINTLSAGNQSVTITDVNGCDTTVSFTITEPAAVSINMPDSIFIRLGEEDSVQVVFDANTDSLTYTWSPDFGLSCTDCREPIFSPYVTTNYTLGIVDSICPVSADITVVVDPNPKIFYIPNAFTPNQDGTNDLWRIEVKGTMSISIEVFDRWGSLVYQAEDLSGWDGTFKDKLLDPGVYVYNVTAVFLDRTLENRKGSIVLLR